MRPARRIGEPILATVSRSTGSRLRVFSPDGKLARRQLASDRSNLSADRSEHSEMDQGRRPAHWTAASMRSSERSHSTNLSNLPIDRMQSWPEAVSARATGKTTTAVRNAPDLTPVISAAVPMKDGVLLATTNDRAFTHTVRSQRAIIAGSDGDPRRNLGIPFPVPRANDRSTASSSCTCGPSGAARPFTRGQRASTALDEPTRSVFSHEQFPT